MIYDAIIIERTESEWHWEVIVYIDGNTKAVFDGWTMTKREAQAWVKKVKGYKL